MLNVWADPDDLDLSDDGGGDGEYGEDEDEDSLVIWEREARWEARLAEADRANYLQVRVLHNLPNTR